MKRDIFSSIIAWLFGIINLADINPEMKSMGLLFIAVGFFYIPFWKTTKDDYEEDDKE